MGLFKKIGNALRKTREAIARKIDAMLSHGELDDDFYDDLTDVLISCDIGVRISMDIVDSLKLNIQKAFQTLGQEVALNDVVIEHSKDPSHGDYATNAAMKLCRLFSIPPRDVANLLINELTNLLIQLAH